MTIPEYVDAIRRAVEERTVECQGIQERVAAKQDGYFHLQEQFMVIHDFRCCHGIRKVPNPAYAQMLEVVREGCVFCGTKGQVAGWKCAYCDDGIRPRSWEGMPDWWPAVLIMNAAIKAGLFPPMEIGAYVCSAMDDPEGTCDAVLAALEEVKGG